MEVAAAAADAQVVTAFSEASHTWWLQKTVALSDAHPPPPSRITAQRGRESRAEKGGGGDGGGTDVRL